MIAPYITKKQFSPHIDGNLKSESWFIEREMGLRFLYYGPENFGQW